jgi:hypothetical protein
LEVTASVIRKEVLSMSKGGSNTSSTQIPAWLENAAIENINKGRDVSQIGYTPYYGADVAAFNPMQQQSMQSTGNAASAFGLAPQNFDAMAGMPEAQTFAGGVQGYSSAPLYEQAVSSLAQNRPAQYNAINSMFIDPFTGAPAQGNYAASPTQVSQMFSNGGDMGGGTGGGGISNGSTGEYYGVNEQYNPLGYSNPTEDISGDGVADYRDMSFGEAGRRDIGFGENVGNFIKSATGIGAIEKAMDYGQGLADGFTPSPSNGLLTQTSGAMDPADARNTMDEAAARYETLMSGINNPENVMSNTPAPYQVETYGIPSPNITGGPNDLMSLVAEADAARAAEALRVEAAQVAAQQAQAAAPPRARQSNNNEGAGAAQRSAAADRNSSGGGYGGGGGSYDPSGRW